MTKRLITIISVFLVGLLMFVGCANSNIPYVTIGPETYYEYGLNERCSGTDGYCEVKSFSITNSYNVDNVANENNYYAIVGIETDLSDDVLSDTNNRAELFLWEQELLVLDFLLLDHNDGCSLIFKLPISKSVDYQKLSQIAVSSEQTSGSYISIFLGYFDTYCQVNGENYVGSCFILPLTYSIGTDAEIEKR
jgi:hypothetical protein